MGNEVTYSIKIITSGQENLHQIVVEADQVKKNFAACETEAMKFSGTMQNATNAVTAFQTLQTSVEQLTGLMKNLTEAFTAQEVAEVKLDTIMKQRMNASEEDIESIKNQAKEQQKLGVVSDQVQLSGAQQLATFLKHKQSLATLIPAMNDLLVQQKGLNATQEDSREIGNLMGKAMLGQTEVLKRAGISFTDAQVKMLKYCNEEDRAGKLAEIIVDNVGHQNDAMSKTDAGKAKQLSNAFEDEKEKLGGLLAPCEQYITVIEAVLGVGANLGMVAMAIQSLRAAHLGATIAAAEHAAAERTNGLMTKIAAASCTLLGFSEQGEAIAAGTATVATEAFAAALTLGLSVVITAVVVGLGKLISYLTTTGDAEEDAAGKIDEASAAREQENGDIEKSRSELEMNIQKLKEFKGSKSAEKKVVEEMNNTYGQTMGYFSSVSQWYKALTANSSAYCDQLIVEARMRTLANQIAEKEQDNHNIRYNANGSTRMYSTQRDKTTDWHSADGYGSYQTQVEVKGSSAQEKAQKSYDDNTSAIKSLKEQLHSAATDAGKITMKMRGAATPPDRGAGGKSSGGGGTDTEVLVKNAKSYADLGHNIEIWQKALDAADPSDKATIARLTEQIEKAKSAQQAIKDMQGEMSRPAKLETLQDYDDEIARQEGLLKRATDNERAGINSNITRLKAEKDAKEQALVSAPIVSEIKTYKQLDDAINYYDSAMQKADATTRPALAAQIALLNKMREQWQDVDNAVSAPAGIEQLSTYKQLDDAISYYNEAASKAEGDQRSQIEDTIAALQRKRQMLQDLSQVHASQELNDLKGLTDKELTIKLKEIGIDGIKKKIKDLNELMSSPEATQTQKKNIAGQIKQWQNLDVKLRKSQVSFRDTWNDIKGLGNGLKSLSAALKGNGNAWDKLTGIVDAGIEIFDAIMAVIQIVKALTAATTAEQGTEAATQAATNGTEAATWMGLAAAKTAAAYADIPFVGEGLALAQIGILKAAVTAAAVTPFANGAVLYGPVMGLMGEYQGASRNPEIVAPLDKLRGIIGDSGGKGSRVRFVIKGRNLEGVLEKRLNVERRS